VTIASNEIISKPGIVFLMHENFLGEKVICRIRIGMYAEI
jgi:hypothetical protein